MSINLPIDDVHSEQKEKQVGKEAKVASVVSTEFKPFQN
jgi:hypothetical protein